MFLANTTSPLTSCPNPLVSTRGRMTMKTWYYSQLHTLPRSNSLKNSNNNKKFFAYTMITHLQNTLESQTQHTSLARPMKAKE